MIEGKRLLPLPPNCVTVTRIKNDSASRCNMARLLSRLRIWHIISLPSLLVNSLSSRKPAASLDAIPAVEAYLCPWPPRAAPGLED